MIGTKRPAATAILACWVTLIWLTGCFNGAGPTDVTPKPTRLATPTMAVTADAAVLLPSPTTSPAPTAAPTSSPTPTPDPNLPGWTILVYMAADNNLDGQAVANLNQLEAAGGSEEVRVVVQIDRAAGADWTEARRYLIAPDEDTQAIGSQLLVDLGEVNSGDPAVLADFLAWGTATYPAKRTALILWNHGLGWSGIASDDTSADVLTLPELESALAQERDGQPAGRFELIGFDACLMGQLDVYAAVAPFGRVAVASEELIPGRGWAYRDWLAALQADPTMDGRSAGRAAVDTFLTTYRDENPFVTLAAVDLEQVPAIKGTLLDLTTALDEDLTTAAGELAMARYAAETFARAYGVGVETYAAVDLRHLAAILAGGALTDGVRRAAADVVSAVDKAVIHAGRGTGFEEAHGVALYFPTRPEAAEPDYADESALPGWEPFLGRFFEVSAAELAPPTVAVSLTEPDKPASVQAPTHLAFQVAGRDIEAVTLLAGRYEEDGRRQLFELDPLIPEPNYLADGSRQYGWRDGLHEDFLIWTTRITFLSDGNEGQYVVMWPVGQVEEPGGTGRRRSLPGLYTRGGTGEQTRVNLVFDMDGRRIETVWGVTMGQAPFELQPAPGDFFQPDRLYLDAENTIRSEPGVTLKLDESAQLLLDWRPVPTGRYFIGFMASNAAGAGQPSLVDLEVDNSLLAGDDIAYLDPYLGFQFLYPAGWYSPVYRDQVLFTTDTGGSTQLRITLFPDAAGATPQSLKGEALAVFGPIQLLYEEDGEIGGSPAQISAYGYNGPAGDRTGLFATFVHEGVGYVVDLDGPFAEEAATLAAWEALVSDWTFRPVGKGLFPNRWATVEADGLIVARPDNFQLQVTEGGWQRFSDPHNAGIFVALRRELGSAAEERAELDRWTAVAGRGVDNFQISDAGRFALGNRLWQRRNFAYDSPDGEAILGFIMVSWWDGAHVVAWGEAPARTYTETERSIFEIMLAELR